MTDTSLPLQTLIEHLRWLGRPQDAADRQPRRGGMGEYQRAKDAALRDAYQRTADELAALEGADDGALLKLAASLRERCLVGYVPDDVRPPVFPLRADRPPPTLDPVRALREAQIGYQLGLARAAALIHEFGGGHY